MHIAQVAPLYETVPPTGYGGTERVVAYLSDELVRRGHDVTLFASGDSRTTAHLVPCSPRALRNASDIRDPLTHHLGMLDEVARRAGSFDLIHFHVDYLAFPFAARCPVPSVSTLHGRLDLPDLPPLYQRFSQLPLVSISDSQRRPLPFANWVRTVYHGLPEGEFAFHARPGSYLAFLGRIAPEKRPDRAIEIAKRAGLPLKMAAKVDPVDREYYRQEILPLLQDPLIEYIGEIGDREKSAFLGGALAVLFPIDWPEPFGLVMIEAMACGTPVVAFRCGSVPEIMSEGKTGFVVGDLDEAVAAIGKIEQIDRAACRRVFENRFSVAAMTDRYLEVYGCLMGAAQGQDAPGLLLEESTLAAG